MTIDRLSQLTIIIPSFERQKYLERQLRMWRATSVRVEILDGSPCAWQRSGEEPWPANVRYWHLPCPLEERLGVATTLITTPFAVLLADDEFYLPSSLHSCIERLTACENVVACKGLAVAFDATDQGVVYWPIYEALRGYKIDQDRPAERVMAHMQRYCMATLWAVMKTDVFNRSLRALSATGRLASAAAGEIQIGLVTSWYGKCEVLDELMWLRSFENANVWWENGRLRFHRWYSDPRWREEVQGFVDQTVTAAGANGAPECEVRDAMERALAAYVDSCNLQKQESSLLARLWRTMPDAVMRKGNSLIASYAKKRRVAGWSSDTAEAAICLLERSGVVVNWAELSSITALIREFHG